MIRLGKYLVHEATGAIVAHLSANDWISMSQSNSVACSLAAILMLALLSKIWSLGFRRSIPGLTQAQIRAWKNRH